jgi:HAMP domain-containing protein
LLVLTALAYKLVRRLLRPLDDIRAGAQRYGGGDFTRPIAVRRQDELGDLAVDINAMAHELHQMLEAKRALLLAISHELRSPLTRARLNTELLPETPELASMRQALLRDLGEMRDLVTDLLESERLGQGHAVLHLEPTDLSALAQEVALEVAASMPSGRQIQCHIAPGLPVLPLDRTRMRLLLRNLLDNALRHSAEAEAAPESGLAAPRRTVLPRGRRTPASDRRCRPGALPLQAGGASTWRRFQLAQCPAGPGGTGSSAGRVAGGSAHGVCHKAVSMQRYAGCSNHFSQESLMNTQELATAFTDLCRAGKFDEAAKRFWSDDVVSREPVPGEESEAKGRAALEAKAAWWYANNEVHSMEVGGPYVHGDQFVIRFKMDLTPKGQARMQMDEVGLYTVKDGEVVEERFFYGS